jgi:hypothetical protein
LPSQSIFLTGESKADYLAGEPKDDARFEAVFAHSLEHAGGYSPEEAVRVAKTLPPDVLLFDPMLPAAYPHNGRGLSDDVMDVFISTTTRSKLARDNVGLHKDLLAQFPYLGAPHISRLEKLVAGV